MWMLLWTSLLHQLWRRRLTVHLDANGHMLVPGSIWEHAVGLMASQQLCFNGKGA